MLSYSFIKKQLNMCVPAFFWSLFHFVVLPFFMWHRLISINNINTFSMGEFHTTFLLEHNKGLKKQNFDFRAQFLTKCTLILEASVLHVREQLWAFVCYWCCWWFCVAMCFFFTTQSYMTTISTSQKRKMQEKFGNWNRQSMVIFFFNPLQQNLALFTSK